MEEDGRVGVSPPSSQDRQSEAEPRHSHSPGGQSRVAQEPGKNSLDCSCFYSPHTVSLANGALTNGASFMPKEPRAGQGREGQLLQD